jgi:hypothetical protein
VTNADKLTGVQVNGKKVSFFVNSKDVLFINMPQLAGEGTVITLISSNGSINYTLNFKPATEIENVVMNEARNLGSWAGEDAGGAFRIYKAKLKENGFAVGSKLLF